MDQLTMTPKIIEKESVSALHFASTDVLATEDERKIRASMLNRAIRLGNNQKRKVKIVFEDNTGVKQVETTVWAVTEKNILLKAGAVIPINRIHKISAY